MHKKKLQLWTAREYHSMKQYTYQITARLKRLVTFLFQGHAQEEVVGQRKPTRLRCEYLLFSY